MDFGGRSDNKCDLEISAMHPNVSNPLPNAHNTEIIESFMDIAKQTGQSSKVMNFPPIDHDNLIKWVVPYQVCNVLRYWFATSTPLWQYDHTKQIFVNSYLWLFPGGVGDIYDMEQGEVPIKEWGQHFLRYFDGLFLDDSLFGLCWYNSIQLHMNNREGIFSSTLTISVGKPHQQYKNWNSSFVTKIPNT